MWRAPSLDYLAALSDDVGVAQHATYDVPNRHEGYCTDDVARAFIVALAAAEHDRERETALRLANVYLAFLLHAQRDDGRFANFMSYERTWLDEAGTPDSNGRALWALGSGARFAPRESWRQLCIERIDRALPRVADLPFLRSQAYATLGLVQAFEASGRSHRGIERALRDTASAFVRAYRANATAQWDWFEAELTYDNARLPEAMLRIGTVLDDRALVDVGVRTLEFYERLCIEDGTFVPIGNAGWYRRGGERARYAQQPLEAASLVDVAGAAEVATGDRRYRRLAECGLEWFYGRNSRNIVMAAGGGCYDGLEEFGVNRNMGAESTLAYLASAFALAYRGANVLQLAR
ncbi:MAG: glycosyl transferase [Vulcanimicrobiaceae bacterium]